MQVANNPKWLSGRYRVLGLVISGAKFLIAVLLLYSSGSAAESPTSDWQAEWQRVMAAAKQEGKVVVSVPPGAELRKALKETFERRFGIELELVTGRGSTIVKKIADEHTAGVQFFDVHTGGSGAVIYGLAGIVEPVESQFILPEVKDPKNWWGWPSVRGQSPPICLFVSRLRPGGHLVQHGTYEARGGPCLRRSASPQMEG
jgi:hypothetical protein